MIPHEPRVRQVTRRVENHEMCEALDRQSGPHLLHENMRAQVRAHFRRGMLKRQIRGIYGLSKARLKAILRSK